MNNPTYWTLDFEYPRHEGDGIRGALGLPFTSIEHRGHRYPEQFTAHWKRGDGLTVDLTIQVDSEIGPRAVSMAIASCTGLVDPGDYRLPLPSMVKQVAKHVAWPVKHGSGSSSIAPPPGDRPGSKGVPMGAISRTKRADSDDRLRQVARLWREASEAREAERHENLIRKGGTAWTSGTYENRYDKESGERLPTGRPAGVVERIQNALEAEGVRLSRSRISHLVSNAQAEGYLGPLPATTKRGRRRGSPPSP